MCRWFAYISNTEPCLLEDILIRPQHALTKQVNDHYLPHLFHHMPGETQKQEQAEIKLRNILHNTDGTGVGFYSWVRDEYGEAEGARPMIYKTIQPPGNDANFQSLCANTSALCVLAHIRMATSAVHMYNNHPFAFGRHLFMHNGTVANFTDIRREMTALMSPKAHAAVQGSTDSEHVAALYMTYLGEDWERKYPLQEMKRALDRAIGTVLLLQKQLGPEKAQANSLNLCTTDGDQLVAVRFRNHEVEQPPSLYYSTQAGATLNRKYPDHPNGEAALLNADVENGIPAGRKTEEHGKHVIVASEPTTYRQQDWKLIGKNMAVMVDEDMNVTVEPVVL
ncbi:N-terminal nucleophile aminohydrolase [Dacryopinax primogenitus]|uniref:N-terminal nucleophile aminohydrolase n=1 Tax=Dacryopinax primogenitus (strain DJM 731) TaxID=1858805 RepID=M5FYV4_DACPD|nr:N-terminal nucleophile aminohydrolase [Dacryopinax primogenitus]EJU01085.1 N-terminal nucleophile aminohydrolase [Dacryopinax primogenitus]